VIDELIKLSPSISDPHEVAAGKRNRPRDADLRPLESFPQAPQSCYPAAADPWPVNPQDNRRLSVYPHVEVEPTANVCPSGPSRDAGDQGRDGRVIWAGSRSEPARQGRGRGRSFDSGHGNARLITIVETSIWSVEPPGTAGAMALSVVAASRHGRRSRGP